MNLSHRSIRAALPLLLSLAAATSALAEGELPPPPPPPPPEEPAQHAAVNWKPPEQKGFAFGVEAGVIGLGANVRLGSSAYGVSLAASLNPVLLVLEDDSYFSQGPHRYDVRATGDFRADGYAYFIQTERAHFGLLGGGSYNTLLGPGFNLGAGAVVSLWKHCDLQIAWTIGFYPDAASHLRDHGIGNGSSDQPVIPWLQGGGGAIGLLFHP